MKVRNGFVSNSSSTAFIISAEKAVDAILNDLKGRHGFDCIWDSLDDDIKDEIRQSWIKLADDATIEIDWPE